MLKTVLRSRAAQSALAFLGARYLRLVERTTRFVVEPADFRQAVLAEAPAIGALWHGQHICAHFAWPDGLPVAALISRNRDAEVNAMVLARLGVQAIRGSGGGADRMHRRGGFAALREMLRSLQSGVSLVLTADVPKTGRVCGSGVIALAKHSGRPIFPLAVVGSRRIDFNSWDRASLILPFGRGAIVVGAPVRVAADAGPQEMERARLVLQAELDAVHARAYALVGARDPGEALAGARATRDAAEAAT